MPQLGGVNCARFVNGECLSKMSNGERWQDYYNQNVIACPVELPFETKIVIDGAIYTCKDRGGAIEVTENGEYWVDVLGDAIAPHGTVKDAYILKNSE